jgi:hypothetical protein
MEQGQTVFFAADPALWGPLEVVKVTDQGMVWAATFAVAPGPETGRPERFYLRRELFLPDELVAELEAAVTS